MVRKRTKIVATISDKNSDPDFIRQLYEAGMDVVRINSAHLDIPAAIRIIDNVRQVSEKIAILIDTKGPEIRTTVSDDPVKVVIGNIYRMTGDPGTKSTPENICVSLAGFSEVVPLGSVIMIDDGDVELRVIRKEGKSLYCRADSEGIIGSRKSVNIPGVRIPLPSVTERDKAFLKMAAEKEVDFIAHSFVRSKQDVLDVQAELDKYKSDIKIIAKIE
ncbi:MAG TPA: pyruvate kinase, partial [Bacteroidales bacterium]|nr:pyruvate kinase [Bacteroidales bacterium]